MLQLHQLIGARNGQRLWGPLDVQLPAGQLLHVRGPNGSGKTTLLRTLAGLRPPARGRVERPAGGCGWLGHALPCAELLDAEHNVQHWLALSPAPVVARPDAIRQTLQTLAVPLGRPLRRLSAGQRRRSALALLALSTPALWVLDEPFDALDTSASTWLAEQLGAHLARAGCVVLTSHQPLPAALSPCTVLDLGAHP